MKWPFFRSSGLILIKATIEGALRVASMTLALDTGATHTFLRKSSLERLGYSPDNSPNKVRVTTGSGEEYAPVIELISIDVLGQFNSSFSVSAVNFPDSASVEGVLGLDFFRDRILTINFCEGYLLLK